MTAVHFRLGRYGHDACARCDTFVDLVAAAPQLAPGQYWIEEMYEVDGYPDPLPLDWGTLEVCGPSNWRLRFLPRVGAARANVIVRPADGMH